MKIERKWLRIAAGAAVALTLALVLAVGIPMTAAAYGGFGRFGAAGQGGDLADALGITDEELQDAHEKAFEAALDQAVEDGLLTETMAEQIKERSALGFGRMGRMGWMGRFGHIGPFGGGSDMEALLAEALGITVEELQAARDKAAEAALASAVEEGRITEEQADLMRARRALQDYMAEQGVVERLRSTYEEAIEGAVKAGVITQEQADQITSGMGFGFGCGRFGMRGHGFGGHGFRGGWHGKPSFDSNGNTGTGMPAPMMRWGPNL